MFKVNYSTFGENNNKIVNILISIKAEQLKAGQTLHPAYNEFQEKLTEIIDWILESLTHLNQMDCAIDKIIYDLQREKETILHKKKKHYTGLKHLSIDCTKNVLITFFILLTI
jgi:hypothetical protein